MKQADKNNLTKIRNELGAICLLQYIVEGEIAIYGPIDRYVDGTIPEDWVNAANLQYQKFWERRGQDIQRWISEYAELEQRIEQEIEAAEAA
jgi:hypothetical protein